MGHYKYLKYMIILLVIPALMFISVRVMNNQNYYFISTLILVALMVPFGLEYMNQEPDTKKLVLTASLAAIAAIGRIAFYMIPQFKPVLAIVILAGVLVGAYEGFMVGALTGFVTNFYFGQGPWTVWQMFAFGLAGFIAGVLFHKIKFNRLILCIYGLISAFLIYGLIMNLETVIMYPGPVTSKRVLAVYAAGLPFDCIHGLATYVFLFFIYHPFVEKINRIKMKYNIS